VRRFIEPAIAPRATVWVYFASLASMAVVVLGLSIFLFLFLAPHWLMGRSGTACVFGTYCLHALPPWLLFTLWLSVTAILGWMIVRMGWTCLVAVRASGRVRRAVLARATPITTSSKYPVYEAADPTIFAWTAGFWRPFILVTQGLRESLPPEELDVVLAHEEAHASGHDNLILLVSRIIGSALRFFPGATRAHAGVRRSVEISADAFASRGTGDRLLVAMSVSRVARLLIDPVPFRSFAAREITAAFAHGELAVERVQRLVGDQHPVASRRRLLFGVASLALVLIVFGASLHSVSGNSLRGDPGAVACAEHSSR
jgi:Zn-dependent protease with chaperone function